MRMLPFAATLLALATFPAAAASIADVNGRIDTVLGDHKLYQTAIDSLQRAVATANRADVAALVRYPITVSLKGKRTTIKNAAAFIKNYDAIMTPDIVKAVVEQKYADLFVRDQGVMFGNGEVWINGICLDKGCTHFVPHVITIQHVN
jgi:bifunctional ADP-heptose synthase (sugar kinase/adenylyltransferase)